MELRKLNLQDAEAEWEYTTALPADENGLTNPFHGVSYDDYMEKVLPELISWPFLRELKMIFPSVRRAEL